jgi:hypothetical protein
VCLCRSRAKYPHLRFETVDAFDLEKIKALSPSSNKEPDCAFDKICIDIGGIAELHTVMSLVGLYFRWACDGGCEDRYRVNQG